MALSIVFDPLSITYTLIMIDHFSEGIKQELPNRWKWFTVILLFFSLLALLGRVYHPLPGRLVLELATPRMEIAQLFWLDDNKGYSVKNSSRIKILPNENVYQFNIAPVYQLKRLRFDPSIKDSKIVLKSIWLEWGDDTVFKLSGVELEDVLIPIHSVNVRYHSDTGSMLVESNGLDPIIEIDVEKLSGKYRFGKQTKNVLIASLFALILATVLYYFNSSSFFSSSHTTYPSRKIQWVYWLLVCISIGVYLCAVTPLELHAGNSVVQYLAQAYTIGVGIFVFSFWFVNREMKLTQYYGTSRWTWLWYAIPSYVTWLIFLLSFWPGSMSPDSLDQWKEVQTGHFRDWHPAFHTMTIWLVTRINISPATVAITQIVALGSTFGWGLSVLQRYGVPRSILWFNSFVIAMLPVNGFMVVTLWKDVAYSIVVIILSMYLFQIVMSKGKWLTKQRNWYLLAIILALVSLYRHNGIMPAVGSAVLLLAFYRRHWRGLLISIAIAVVLHSLVRGPLYDVTDVRRGNPLGRIQEMTKAEFKRLFDEQTEKNEKVGTDKQESPPTADNQNSGKKKKELKDDKRSNPLMDRVYSASRVWRLLPMTTFHKHMEYVNLWQKPDGLGGIKIKYVSSNNLGVEQNSLFPQGMTYLYSIFRESRYNKYLFWMWRPAFYLYTLIGLLILLSWRLKNRLYFVLVPTLLNSIPLFLIVIHKSIFRYHFPTVMLGVLLVIPLLFLKPVDHPEPE